MLNKVMLIGNIGKDVEGKALNTGTYIANTSLATTSTYKGEKQTEWHNLVFFGKTAEIASQYVRKGSKIYVDHGMIRKASSNTGRKLLPTTWCCSTPRVISL